MKCALPGLRSEKYQGATNKEITLVSLHNLCRTTSPAGTHRPNSSFLPMIAYYWTILSFCVTDKVLSRDAKHARSLLTRKPRDAQELSKLPAPESVCIHIHSCVFQGLAVASMETALA